MSISRVGSRAVRRLALCGLVACALMAGCASEWLSAAGPTHAADGSPRDWRNATYTMTCDGIVPHGFRATLDDGATRVPADAGGTPSYLYYDVRFEAEASGDVDGDRTRDTVVLLQCSPQPSNGILEEAHVFAAGGDEIGVLPSPRTLRENTMPAPVYDPTGLSIRDGDIVAEMTAYGPDDFHASGPSVPITVRWHWDGTAFVRVP
jgi:hypothetical protein